MTKRNHSFVLPTGFDLGGVVTWSVAMARALTSLGVDAGIIRHGGATPAASEAVAQLRVVDCPGTDAWNAFSTDEVTPYLSTYAATLPGTLIPNWSYGTYAACALLSQTNAEALRVIGFCHADEDGYYEWLVHYEPIIHTFVAVSDDIALKLRDAMPHRTADIVTRPYGVGVLPRLDRRYSSEGEPIRLMYAGRIENQQKRIRDLVALAALLQDRKVDFELRVLGSGSEERWLQQQVERMNAAAGRRRVVLEGAVPHHSMQDHWRASDVCILVSNYEGTSISMLEAMAQGCVPVVTAVSGTAAVLRPGVNGFTVPVGDMPAMAGLIAKLAGDRSALQAAGAEAHRTVADGYSFDRYVPWFVELSGQAWERSPRQWPANRPLLHRKPTAALVPPSVARRIVAKAKQVARLGLGSRGLR